MDGASKQKVSGKSCVCLFQVWGVTFPTFPISIPFPDKTRNIADKSDNIINCQIW